MLQSAEPTFDHQLSDVMDLFNSRLDIPPILRDKVGLSSHWFDHPLIRARVLKEAAWLGADLLAPQEAAS